MNLEMHSYRSISRRKLLIDSVSQSIITINTGQFSYKNSHELLGWNLFLFIPDSHYAVLAVDEPRRHYAIKICHRDATVPQNQKFIKEGRSRFNSIFIELS